MKKDKTLRNKQEHKRSRNRYGSGFISRKKKVKANLIMRDGPHCQECLDIFDPLKLTIDHIIEAPPKKRQDNHMYNLRLLCWGCHKRKNGWL